MGFVYGLIKGSCGISKGLEVDLERKAIIGVGSGTTSLVFWGRVIVSSGRNLESGNKMLARVSFVEGSSVKSGTVGTDVNGRVRVGGMKSSSGFSSLVGEEE
jgi:hypothetical protein